MKVVRHREVYDKDTLATFVGLGDLHYGTKNFDDVKFKKFIDWAKVTENLFIFLMGDLGEFINHKDSKRFNPDNIISECLISLGDIINFQVKKICELLEPIKDRIRGTVIGNHEEMIQHHFVDDLYYDICKRLGILEYDLGIGGFIVYDFEHKSGGNVKRLTFNVQHTMSTGRKLGGKSNRLEDLFSQYECDVIMRGHSHDRLAVPFLSHYVSKSAEHKERKRLGIITGSFLKTRKEETTSYADKADYPSKDRGVVIVTFNPNNADLHAMV